MANNGNSSDYKIFRNHLCKDKLLPVLETDNKIDLLLKNKINIFIEKHGYEARRGMYFNHFFEEKRNLVINLNQIRQKYWYFKPLKIKL